MARVILAVDDCRRPFFGNSGVVVFLCLGFSEVSSATSNCRRAFSELSSGLPTLEKANPLGVASNQDHSLLWLLETCRLNCRRRFNPDWVTASPIEAPHPPSRRRLFVVRNTAVLPFLRLQFCWRGLYSRRVPRTSAIPSSGPPSEPTISSAPAGALSRRMPRRRT